MLPFKYALANAERTCKHIDQQAGWLSDQTCHVTMHGNAAKCVFSSLSEDFEDLVYRADEDYILINYSVGSGWLSTKTLYQMACSPVTQTSITGITSLLVAQLTYFPLATYLATALALQPPDVTAK